MMLRLLVVEDSEADTELICRELQRGGYAVDVRRVDTEADFVAALENAEWDLIISDFSMPRFDGLRAYELFRDLGYDIPFIFVSGAMGEERAVQAMKAGARDYILKGHLGRLNAAVQRELAEAEARRKGREAEAEKAQQQRRLAVALQATRAGVFEYNVPDGSKAYFNERFSEILGYGPGEVPAPPAFRTWFFEQIHPDEREQAIDVRERFIRGEIRDFTMEFRIRHKDGKWRHVTCHAAAAQRRPDGSVAELIGVLVDRTEEKRLEEQFRQAQKMEAIGRLAGGIAHDFNNLLTVISNFGEFVLDRLAPGTTEHDDMQEVLKAARRAEKLTGQLLAYSRRRPVAPTVLDVNALVAGVDKMLRSLIGDDIELRTDLAPDLWNVKIDAGGLEQVLVNLAVNARDAMPDGGRLSLETRNAVVGDEYATARGRDVPAGRYVVISVTDTGIGMDEETRSRLFEPFFTTKEPGQGTGLGLATCYGIVKQAGGFIWVYSEPGHGSTFRVLLPRASGEAEAEHEPTHSERLRGQETLLVVEDEEPVRTLVVRLLRMLGYRIHEAGSAAEALDIARTCGEQIQGVLTDIVMPEMNGPALVSRLKEIFPDIRPVYMSGYTRGAIRLDETITLVQKPFAPHDLARKVRDVLDAPQKPTRRGL
ncbi:MAG TPA: response regulator [Woeseiaceae bacterium]|nr:response regulator [Woeseiaceae bacterium]